MVYSVQIEIEENEFTKINEHEWSLEMKEKLKFLKKIEKDKQQILKPKELTEEEKEEIEKKIQYYVDFMLLKWSNVEDEMIAITIDYSNEKNCDKISWGVFRKLINYGFSCSSSSTKDFVETYDLYFDDSNIRKKIIEKNNGQVRDKIERILNKKKKTKQDIADYAFQITEEWLLKNNQQPVLASSDKHPKFCAYVSNYVCSKDLWCTYDKNTHSFTFSI